MLGVNELIARFPPLGYRARILVCSAAATAAPLLLLVGQGGGTPAIVAGMASLWFLFCVHRLLLPLRDVAHALDACIEAEPSSDSDMARGEDEIERMMTSIDRIADRLDAARRRELDTMVGPGLPDEFAQRSGAARRSSR